jgi:hypothetical protein
MHLAKDFIRHYTNNTLTSLMLEVLLTDVGGRQVTTYRPPPPKKKMEGSFQKKSGKSAEPLNLRMFLRTLPFNSQYFSIIIALDI